MLHAVRRRLAGVTTGMVLAGALLVTPLGSPGVPGAEASSPTSGELDATFNPPVGFLTTRIGDDAAIGGLAEQPGGQIVAAGTTSRGMGNDNAVVLVRYEKDGAIDESFGEMGMASFAFGFGPEVVGLHTQGTGRGNADLVTVGETEDGFFALRHDRDGQLDTSFGAGGQSLLPVDEFDDAAGSDIQDDGKIVAVGSVGNPFAGTSALVVARFDADGGADPSFGGGDGIVTLEVLDGSVGFGVTVQPDGRIVAVGAATQPPVQGGAVMLIARFLPDGSLDTSFGGVGYVTLEIGDRAGAFDVEVFRDRILVSGNATADDKLEWAIARFEMDGSLDTSFAAPVGYVTASPASPDIAEGFAADVEVQSNGAIVAAGPFGPNLAETNFFVARFTRDGKLDADFGTDGFTSTVIGSFSEPSTAILQRNGRIVVGGYAVAGVIGLGEFALARYIG